MIENILSKKWIYFFGLVGVVLFIRQDRIILNAPFALTSSLFIVPFLFIFFLVKYKKSNSKCKILSKKKYKDNILIDLAGITVLSFLSFVFLKVTMDYFIIINANNLERKQIKVSIDNYIPGRSELIYFTFKNKSYSLRIDNSKLHLERQVVIDEYMLNFEYETSLFNIYVIKKYNIEKKNVKEIGL